MQVWNLKKGEDRRLRSQHPWVFSNELIGSPKGVQPGEPVEVRDFKGHFVARGYGNPHSLISFRALSFDSKIENPASVDYFVTKLLTAWTARYQMGLKNSFRLCFSEADGLPGIIVDLYEVAQTTNINSSKAQVFCFQSLTAGVEKVLMPDPLVLFKKLTEAAFEKGLTSYNWDQTMVVSRNDVNIRKLEGLDVPKAQILKTNQDWDLQNISILIESLSERPLPMSVDLVEGQKTGFFLDQSFNIRLLGQLLQKTKWNLEEKTQKVIRILDLCCYMGQWGALLADALILKGYKVEVTLVDVSEKALICAQKNVERTGAQVIALKKDVLEHLGDLPSAHYDIVIADPPAFIKARKDIPLGKHAYLKLNTQAFRVVKPDGGWVASCSCSGLLTEEDFKEVISKAMIRNGRSGRMVLHGGHAPDHPTVMNFSEGFYLKMFVNFV
jgi:23S rRNA (cytosine1962-C5)-methyltransferase